YVVVKNMTIDGSAQTPGLRDMFCIKVSSSDHITLDNLEVINAGWSGMETFSLNHSLIQNIHAHSCYHHGVHGGTQEVGRNMYNTYRNIDCWNNGIVNGSNGFDEIGNESHKNEKLYNTFDNINSWDNGGSGIAIFCQGNAA